MQALFRVAVVGLADASRRRQMGEAVAKTLHAPALVVHSDERVGVTQAVDACGEPLDLLRRFEIAGKQDDTANVGVFQDLLLFGEEFGAAQANHQGSQ